MNPRDGRGQFLTVSTRANRWTCDKRRTTRRTPGLSPRERRLLEEALWRQAHRELGRTP